MSKTFFRDYPPCKGDAPYLCLCFHPSDAQNVKPLLEELTKRRCRIWYNVSGVSNSSANKSRTKFETNAKLMVLWLSDCSASSEDMKNALGSYQTTDQPVICIDARSNVRQSGLSMILSKNVQIITREPNSSFEALAATLMRTEGFTQQLIAENDNERQLFLKKRKSRRIALSILFSAIALMICAAIYAQQNDWFRPPIDILDSVTISDPVIAHAARVALSSDGNASLTQDSLAIITTLRLDAPPESFDDLALFPALTRLEIPQSCVEPASALLDDAQYVIVVYPEAVS